MAKKQKQGGSLGGANWMDTWADLVSLLMCFFLLLYAFSNVDEGKFDALSGSLINAFGGVGGSAPIAIPGISMDELSKAAIDQLFWPTPSSGADIFGEDGAEGTGTGTGTGDAIFGEIVLRIQELLEVRGIGGEVLSDPVSFTLIIRFNENILFASGSADLGAEAREVLDAMIDIIVDLDSLITMVRVEGHTDNVRLISSRYRDNLELSGARATNATRYIQDSGRVDETKIYAACYGEHIPIADNGTAEGRQMNRRVDFVIESLNLDALIALRNGMQSPGE